MTEIPILSYQIHEINHRRVILNLEDDDDVTLKQFKETIKGIIPRIFDATPLSASPARKEVDKFLLESLNRLSLFERSRICEWIKFGIFAFTYNKINFFLLLLFVAMLMVNI